MSDQTMKELTLTRVISEKTREIEREIVLMTVAVALDKARGWNVNDVPFASDTVGLMALPRLPDLEGSQILDANIDAYAQLHDLRLNRRTGLTCYFIRSGNH